MRKRKATEQRTPREKKLRPSLTQEHQIQCWCGTLHRLAYPRLVEIASQLLHRPKREIARKFSKRNLCLLLATTFHFQLPKIQSDILQAIEQSSSEELSALDQGIPNACFKKMTRREAKRPHYSLFHLRDPVTLDLVQDFVRIPTQQITNPWLFNLGTLRGLRNQKHPVTQELLSPSQMQQIHVDAKERDKARRRIRQEWGFPFHPKEIKLATQELKNIAATWRLPQAFDLSSAFLPEQEEVPQFRDESDEEALIDRSIWLGEELFHATDQKEWNRTNEILEYLRTNYSTFQHWTPAEVSQEIQRVFGNFPLSSVEMAMEMLGLEHQVEELENSIGE